MLRGFFVEPIQRAAKAKRLQAAYPIRLGETAWSRLHHTLFGCSIFPSHPNASSDFRHAPCSLWSTSLREVTKMSR